MPHAFVLQLRPQHPDTLLEYPSQYAQGLFYHLLETIDPALSHAVHQSKQRNPFTLWCQPRYQRSSKYVASVELRVTLLDDALFAPLLQRVLTHSLTGLALGQSAFHIQKLLATPEGHRDADALSWSALSQTPACAWLELRFLSPTVFATSASDGRRIYTPLPDPRLLLQSWLRVYQRFHPQPYDEHIAAQLHEVFAEHAQVRYLDIHSSNYTAGKTKLHGFTGKASLHVHQAVPEVQQALGRLGCLAFFSGVGAKTAYGMGQVRVRPMPS